MSSKHDIENNPSCTMVSFLFMNSWKVHRLPVIEKAKTGNLCIKGTCTRRNWDKTNSTMFKIEMRSFYLW